MLSVWLKPRTRARRLAMWPVWLATVDTMSRPRSSSSDPGAVVMYASASVACTASQATWSFVAPAATPAGSLSPTPLRTRAIASAKRKTDDIDAATLAELLAADYLPPVWQPDEATRRLRRLVSHRAGLVRDRTGVRNRVTAVLTRRLLRSPVTDLFGVRGRAWLATLELPWDERLSLDAALALRRPSSSWRLGHSGASHLSGAMGSLGGWAASSPPEEAYLHTASTPGGIAAIYVDTQYEISYA